MHNAFKNTIFTNHPDANGTHIIFSWI